MPKTNEPYDQASAFTKARQIVGVGLFGLVAVLAIIDAFKSDYSFELGPMGLMLGTASTLLGVELFRKAIEKIGNGQ